MTNISLFEEADKGIFMSFLCFAFMRALSYYVCEDVEGEDRNYAYCLAPHDVSIPHNEPFSV
jgi:hypothetical protein